MRLPERTPLRELTLAIACAGLVLIAPRSSFAGEKIKIGGTSDKVNLPQDVGKEVFTPDALGPRIGSGESRQGPVLPMPNQPTLFRNPRLDEWIDQKKNWMLNSPSSLDRDKEIKEVFGVRDYDPSGLPKRAKGSMERYFEADKDSKSGPSESRSKDSDDSRENPLNTGEFDRSGRHKKGGEELQRPEIQGIIPALNPAVLFNWDTSADTLNQVGDSLGRRSILPPGLGDPLFGPKTAVAPQPSRDNNPGQREFERSWDMRKMPLRGVNDSFLDQSDAKRYSINPAAAKKAAPILAEPSSSSAAQPYAFGSVAPSSSRPDLLPTTRSLPTPAGFGAPVVAPPSSPLVAPKPAVLEIPRPRF